MEIITNKSDFIKSLTPEEFDNGLIKFDIIDEKLSISESVWGWIPPEYAEKYYRYGDLSGSITTILLNHTLTLFGKVNYGDEVKVKFNKQATPCLDPDWVKENL